MGLIFCVVVSRLALGGRSWVCFWIRQVGQFFVAVWSEDRARGVLFGHPVSPKGGLSIYLSGPHLISIAQASAPENTYSPQNAFSHSTSPQ